MGDDCNLDIMPPRKKKNKVKTLISNHYSIRFFWGFSKLAKFGNRLQMRDNKLNSLKKTTASKSQKRKLKKLEEDKEKVILFAKTADLLEYDYCLFNPDF